MIYTEGITVIEGPHPLTTDILLDLCIHSIISYDRDALFIDGRNSFNPYIILKMTKSLGIDQGDILHRIHVTRAFTEYQMKSLIDELDDAINKWNPYALTISYLSSLFQDSDIRLFKPIIERLICITRSSCKIAMITSHGKTDCDKLLASNADRLINIKQTNDAIRIVDNGDTYEYVHLPHGQMRL